MQNDNPCSQCNKVCETEAQLEQHKKTHSEGVTCDVCCDVMFVGTRG